ncbi:helicase-exonuclease AddAB subunit AddA [Lactococcus termiticola]|uniref:DNA 3'-5' helicase n=1 Tax=Lactococcus termiticola TaxID=2169526 RepID=A0A2R5HFN3_9LACT|nr:helicase-exonuclease AddAB subunit AddA [Lactococcus termiticola]GBG96883.1 ATP-dependent helicase/nuclease subunit A [Lactococcus termiticola]
MPDLKLTAEQEKAIFESGHNILVSASAGSGKTFVMANRIVEKIKSGIPVTGLFISTFTKKAAAELRSRLERDIKLARQQANDEEAKYLLSQALKELPNADIGTMDSFTQRLLKTHFNVVNVDPNFRILADQSEADLIKSDVFDSLVESYLSEDEEVIKAYPIEKSSFEKLMKNFSKDRNIKGFQETVYSVYYYAMATENPLSWLENDFLKGFNEYKTYADLDSSLATDVFEALNDFFIALDKALDEALLTAKTKTKAETVSAGKQNLIKTLETKNYKEFISLFEGLDFSAWKLPAESSIAVLFKQTIGTKTNSGIVRDLIDEVKHIDLIEKYQPEARKVADDLRKFTAHFYSVYLARKLEENLLEYGDVSHLAIKILTDFPEIAKIYQEKYEEIMIDEYQDISHTQEAMLRLLSKNGDGTDNLFMVGDIKQSIYGFRQADPSLFYEKYKSYQKKENHLIRLKENFRSRGEVLRFTNKIFQHLMDERLGEMTYGDEEMLVQGNTRDYPEELNDAYNPEFLIYQEDSSATEKEGDEVSDGEIRIAAERILKLREEKEIVVEDGQELEKQVQWKDIAVLVRSKSSNNKIEDIFNSYGIPVVLDEGRVDFLKSIEVTLMLDVLRAIDNPLQDIPLVALLRSPIFQFDEDELTRIHLQALETKAYWLKLQGIMDGQMAHPHLIDQKLENKIVAFLETFEVWRKLSTEIQVHELLWKIYLDSYYFDYVGSLDNGKMRQANLQALSSRAKSYEASGYKGLFRFIKLIDSFMAQNNDLAAVNIKLPQNAVRVMTFHKSKGLEFNHVFLMNLNKRFNMDDLKKDVILDRDGGIGMKYLADFKQEPAVNTNFPYAMVKMETFPYLANREKKELSSLSEEMRVLYVALTRAEKKLYLIGKIKDSKSKKGMDDYLSAELESGLLADSFRRSSKGFQHWILALEQAIDLPITVKIIDDKAIQGSEKASLQRPNFEQLLEASKAFDGIMDQSDDIQKAKEIMEFNYPYPEATQLSSIQTPSQVKKRAYERQIELGGIAPVSEYVTSKELTLDFVQKKLTAADIGTATHSFMQEVDFHQIDLFSLQAVLDGMNLSDELKEKIDLPKILSLFDQEFGRFLIEHADHIRKEAPFSMLRTDDLAHEQYIVRGICDAFVLLEDRILLLDYKTDRFKSKADIPEIMQRYELQMKLYAEALSKAYGVNQVDKYLILLGGPDQVWVEKYEEL